MEADLGVHVIVDRPAGGDLDRPTRFGPCDPA